jgi:RNA polymerase sigma-70 factor (ECF subfamily)
MRSKSIRLLETLRPGPELQRPRHQYGNLPQASGVEVATVEGRPLEGDLVARARRGDERAYEELVLRYSDLAFRTAYLATGSAADAEDAALEGFVKAHRALDRFREGEPFRPWLLRIVGNEARNRRRAAGRRAEVELKAVRADRAGDAAPSPEAAVLATERRTELLAALNRLEPDARQVVACRYLLELNVAETAAALGVPEGTVKSRLSRALERLRAELEAPAGG